MSSALLHLAPAGYQKHGDISEDGRTSVDIVAVHGLNEDMITAWTELETGVLWLREFLPKDVAVVRVFTFGYASSASSFYSAGCADTIQKHAHTLVACLEAERRLTLSERRPIIFVCHGLGGVVVKKALVYSASRTSSKVEHQYSIFVSTYGILFFGTPHNRFDIARWIVLESIHKSETDPTVRASEHSDTSVKYQSETLDTITDQFAPLMKYFHIFFFWEEVHTNFAGWSGFIVEESSAAPILDNTERSGLDATHSGMVKFSRTDTSGYRTVIAALKRYCRDAPKLVSRRWDIATAALARARTNEAFELVGLDFDLHSDLFSTWSPQEQPHTKAILPAPRKNRIKHFFPPPTTASEFIGRKEASRIVQQSLFPSEDASPLNEQKMFVVHGMGGSGKTQFCSKFAKDNQDRYWAVFTIHATSVETAKQSFATIGKYGGLEETDSAGKYWLSQLEESWLLIIDNADNPELPLRDFFPEGGRGHILISTRNPDFREYGTGNADGTPGSIELKGLEENEALQLLLKRANVPRPWDKATEATGIEIAKSLGYLALALIQAGTSILRKICGLKDYLTFHNKYRRERRARTHSVTSKEDDIVYSAFDFSMKYLESKLTLESRYAIEVLNIVGFYHFEHIRVDIFTRAVQNRYHSEVPSEDEPQPSRIFQAITSRLQPPPVLPAFLRNNLQFMNEYPMNEVLHELASLSLISYDDDKNTSFSLHPLVHAWARDRLDMKEKALWAQIALNTLTEAIQLPPHDLGEIHGQFRKDLLPHLDACLTASPIKIDLFHGRLINFKVSWAKVFQQTSLLIVRDQSVNAGKCGYIYVEQGRFEKAAIYFSMVKDALVQTMGYEYERTMTVMLALGQTYWGLGRLNEAITLQDKVVEVRTKVFGLDHPETLKAMDHLGSSYWLNGQYLDALEIQQQTTKRMEIVLGPDHKDTHGALDNLGVTYGSWHRFQESMEIHQKVLRFRRKCLGDTDPDTLKTMNNLAMALLDLGHLVEAKATMQKVYEVRKVTLGKEHPWTLWALCNLAKVNVELNLLNDAESMLLGGIAAGKRSLGDNHLGVLMGTGELARVYARQKRFEEAEKLTLETVQRLNESRGHTHPDTVYATWKLAQLYEVQGKMQSAVRACELALEKVHVKLTKQYPLRQKIETSLIQLRSKISPKEDDTFHAAHSDVGSRKHAPRRFTRSQRTW